MIAAYADANRRRAILAMSTLIPRYGAAWPLGWRRSPNSAAPNRDAAPTSWRSSITTPSTASPKPSTDGRKLCAATPLGFRNITPQRLTNPLTATRGTTYTPQLTLNYEEPVLLRNKFYLETVRTAVTELHENREGAD